MQFVKSWDKWLQNGKGSQWSGYKDFGDGAEKTERWREQNGEGRLNDDASRMEKETD